MNKKGNWKIYAGIYEYISRGIKCMEKTPIGRNLLLGFSIFAPGGIIYLGLKGKGSIDERKNELNDYNELNLKNSENLKNQDLEKKVE
tara:strand:- start:22 stop:285 length:264 start_codon:yes stop_codon:yes gene_type:complete